MKSGNVDHEKLHFQRLTQGACFQKKFVTCAAAVTAMFAVFNPVVLISGTIFLGSDPHGVFQPAGFAGALVTAWLLFIAYVAVLVAIATLLRSNGAAIATNICLVSIFPTLLQALDFLFGRIGLKIFPVWIGEKLSSVTNLPLPSGAVMAGIFIAILYVIAAGAVGIYLFKKHDVKQGRKYIGFMMEGLRLEEKIHLYLQLAGAMKNDILLKEVLKRLYISPL